MLRRVHHNVQNLATRQKYACYTTQAVFWRKGLNPLSPDRKFSPLKMHLFAQYADIISSNKLLLFVSLRDVPSGTMQKIRRELENTTKPKSSSNPFGVVKAVVPVERLSPKLTFIRSHMFLAAMKRDGTVKGARKPTVPLFQGQMAILALPSLDPDHLLSILKMLERAAPKAKETTVTPASSKSREEEMLTMPPPGGGGMRKAKAPTVPTLGVLGGIVEGQLFMLEGLREVTKLPTLQTLHAQIVGLLSSPGSQLAAVLNQAAGGRLARTLEGLKQSLEKEAEGQ